jgi:hypothetical protein
VLLFVDGKLFVVLCRDYFICLLRGNLIYCAEFLFTSVCVLADFLVCLFWVADLIFAILGLFMLSFPGI